MGLFTLGRPIVGSGFAILPGRPATPGKPDVLPLGGIVDGFLSEEHKIKLTKTTYPVETSGLLLTDHAVVEPRTLKLEGWVSDLLPSVDLGDTPAHPSRGAAAWRQVYALMQEREPVTVVTTLAVYQSMLITSATAPVDRTTGRALRFDLELEEVLFRDVAPALGRVVVGPAVDRVEEVPRGRVQALSTAQIQDILAEITEEIAAGLPGDAPESEGALWKRTIAALGRAANLPPPPAFIRF